MNCMLAALSKILNRSPTEITDEIGHNGTEEWWSGYTRSFHIQEVIDYCFKNGYSLINIEHYPQQSPSPEHTPKSTFNIEQAEERFRNYLDGRKAILYMRNDSGNYHARAWMGFGDIDSRIIEAYILI